MIEIEAPDGSVVEFPEGTSKDVMAAAMRKKYGTPDNSAARGFALGAYKPLENAAAALQMVPGMKQADEWMAKTFGTTPQPQIAAERPAARQANTRTRYQTAGKIAGTLPTMALPGGAAVQGAASGALLTDETDPMGIAKDVAMSAATSYGADKALKFVGQGVRPYVDKGVQKLKDAGVPLTIGQIAGATNTKVGAVVRGIEDRLEGFPLIGNMISGARQRGAVKYNAAVLDRALGHIGEKLPQGATGRDAVLAAGDKISTAYDNLLPNLSAQADDVFRQDMTNIASEISVLPDDVESQLGKIVQQAWGNRAPDGVLSGDDLKAVESVLGKYASKFSTSGDANQQLLGEAVRNVQGSFRSLVERSNPNYQGQLQAANAAWRELAIAEKAAGSTGVTDGVFSAKQYARAARDADKSVRHRATARGTFPNQDVTDAAAATLSNPVPDTGTAGRAWLPYLLMGGGAQMGGTPGTAAVAAGLGMAPYTKAGQAALSAALLGRRPDALRYGATKLSYLSPSFAPALTIGDK